MGALSLTPPSIEGLVPPNDMDAEASVLSSIMIDHTRIAEVLDVIQPEDMYSNSHRRILEAAKELHLSGSAVDIITVSTWLNEHGRLQEIQGGIPYLTEILNFAPYTANTLEYAQSVKRFSAARAMIKTCAETSSRLYLLRDGIDETLEEHTRKVHALSLSRGCNSPLEAIGPVMKEALKEDIAAAQRGDSMRGYSSGLQGFDETMGGLHPTDLTILAARPGMGKTSLLLNIAVNMVDPEKYPDNIVILFSLEMPKKQLVRRMLCSHAGLDLQLFRTRIPNAILPTMIASAKYIHSLPIWICDSSNLSIADMRSIVRAKQSEAARVGKRVVMVGTDYLGLMRHDGDRNSNLAQQIAGTTKCTKNAAKELQVPWVMLCQLNRGVEGRDDKRPMMADLRESGAIEQDADNILMVYRDEKYNPSSKAKGMADLIVVKQRNGPEGTIPLAFDAKSTTFHDVNVDPFLSSRPY